MMAQRRRPYSTTGGSRGLLLILLEQVFGELRVGSWVKAKAWMKCGLSSTFSTIEGV
jgi:hypothetical protein